MEQVGSPRLSPRASGAPGLEAPISSEGHATPAGTRGVQPLLSLMRPGEDKTVPSVSLTFPPTREAHRHRGNDAAK